MIYIQKNDIHATLTTWVYCAMWQLYAAEQQGKKAYINWPNDHMGNWLRDLVDVQKPKHDNAYEWYFKQPHGTGERTETWTWEQWQDPTPVPLMAQPLAVIKEFYQRNLIFSDDVNRRGAQLQYKYGIDFSQTIGITWRGTDNVTDGRIRMPIEKYYRFIDDILAVHPGMRIMCTAEETGILDPLLKRYRQAFVIEEFVSSESGSLRNPERDCARSGFERGMQPTLMVWLFSKCAWYIKNRSSTGAVASWLSQGTIVNLAHAETLNYDKMDDEVEINGKRYPL